MKILLTGGSGFIGRNIIELLGERHVVHAPSHHALDLLDQHSVDKWFANNDVDVVIHCAIKPGHRNANDKAGLLEADLRMFFNIKRNVDSRPHVRMFNIGSGSCYDIHHYEPLMDESYFGRYIPTDETGFAKYIISNTAMGSHNIYDLRVFGIFGKYEDYAIRFISNAICKTLMGLSITIRQDRMFHYVWIEDFVRILERLFTVQIPFPAFNVTPDETITLLSVARMINELTDKAVQPILVSAPGMGAAYTGNNYILKSFLPGLEFTPIRASVEKLYMWYAQNIQSIDRQVLLIDK